METVRISFFRGELFPHKERSEVDGDENCAANYSCDEKHSLGTAPGVEASATGVTSSERTAQLSATALKEDESDKDNGENDLYPRQSVLQ